MEDFYHKYAPRWFKVIRWRELGERSLQKNKRVIFLIYIPVFIWWFNDVDPYIRALIFHRPGTEEERMILKEQNCKNYFVKGFEMDEYAAQIPPMYDTWVRRNKYPQYYGDKYNTFKKYAGHTM